MLWSKQLYRYRVHQLLKERGSDRYKATRQGAPRNDHWNHMYNADVISMSNKWEYRWYAAWDLAFHTLPLAIKDPDFAKDQMALMLKGVYLHPSSQIGENSQATRLQKASICRTPTVNKRPNATLLVRNLMRTLQVPRNQGFKRAERLDSRARPFCHRISGMSQDFEMRNWLITNVLSFISTRAK